MFFISLKKYLNQGKLFVLDTVFPLQCLGCGREGVWLCQQCFKKLKLTREQYCLHCKQPNRFGSFCPHCAPDYALDGVWIAGDYEDKIIQLLIKNLKYHLAKNIAENLGKLLTLFLNNLLNLARLNRADIKQGVDWRKFEELKTVPQTLSGFSASLVIPVPLSRQRLRWRGFNQAEAIARVIAHNFRLPLSNRLLRLKHKKPQAKLTEAERKINVRDCYGWLGGSLDGHNVILIDDVTTTGSTLNECARVLKQAGANEIWGLVAAKG